MIESMPSNTDVQDKVFAFLANPAAHPGIRRIDTHAASVFLGGNHALKIKRAVRFPYLDYSTLAKRKAACDEERPAVRAANLPSRRPDYARQQRTVEYRRRRCTGRIRDRNDAFR